MKNTLFDFNNIN